MKIEKYENLESELTDLQDVLKRSLQNDVLQIKRLVKSCDKFKCVAHSMCNLSEAEYVIYSKYMKKELHNSESFVFIDKTGKNVCHASGLELALYDMVEECDNLIESKIKGDEKILD